jgi:hypothetical protein
MKNALIVVALIVVGWFAYTRTVESRRLPATELQDPSTFLHEEPAPSFSCDGRIHCSQMTSCAEAEFFLRNCPGVEMDGNNDGEPCESQWCGDQR